MRTVDKNQFQARINLGLKDESNAYILGSTYLDKLKASQNGFSYLDCLLKKENRRLYLVIKNGGRTVCREDFSLLPRKVLFRYIFLSAAGVIVVAGLVLFLLTFDFSGIGMSGSAGSRSSQTSSHEAREVGVQENSPGEQPELSSKAETEESTLSDSSRGDVQTNSAAAGETKIPGSSNSDQSEIAGEEKTAAEDRESENNPDPADSSEISEIN